METGILTELMNRLLAALTGGQTQLLAMVRPVASSLALIELAWAAGMWSFSTGDEAMKGFLTKVVKLGIWSFIIFNFPEFAEGIRSFFVQVGLTAAGAGGLPVAVTDPSMIAEMGFDAIRTIWIDFQEQESTLSVGFSIRALVALLVLTVCGLFILMLYYFIALSMFLTVVEFYIVSTIGIVFVPWGLSPHTKWIAERYFGALVALGTKLSVQVFMASVTLPVLARFKLGPEPTFAQTFTLLLGVMAVALLNWRAPNVAAGMMSGSAALGTSDVTTPVANAGSAAMSAAGMLAAGPAGGAAAGAAAAAGTKAIEKGSSVSASAPAAGGASASSSPAASSGAGGAAAAGASVATSAATGGASSALEAGASSVTQATGAAGGETAGASAPGASASTPSSSASSDPASSAAASGAPQASAPAATSGAASAAMVEPVSAPGGREVVPDSGTQVALPAVMAPSFSDATPGKVEDPGALPPQKKEGF